MSQAHIYCFHCDIFKHEANAGMAVYNQGQKNLIPPHGCFDNIKMQPQWIYIKIQLGQHFKLKKSQSRYSWRASKCQCIKPLIHYTKFVKGWANSSQTFSAIPSGTHLGPIDTIHQRDTLVAMSF